MRRLIYICSLILLFSGGLFAQQLPQFSQYLLNKYVINPASAGTENYFLGQTNYRNQWSGIRDAPRTHILSVNGPLQHKKMGIGGYIFTDITGPTRRSGINFSYSYHFQVNDDINISLAVNAGILNFSIDGTEILFESNGDELFSPTEEDGINPDAGFSFYVYAEDYFFGASAPQLIRNELDFKNSLQNPSGRLANHYFIMGGYTYELNSQIDLKPSFLMKYVKPTPIQYEFTLRGVYQDMAWLGFSYRKSDAIGILAGYVLNDKISFGYSYDITQSDLKNYSNGTHEVMLSIKFNRPSPKESDDL